MAIVPINLGIADDDGLGDDLKTAGGKINDSFGFVENSWMYKAIYVVDAGGSNGAYSTIQAAITAAELAGGLSSILITPAIYTEALTISKPGINLLGMTGRAEGQTELVGDITISSDALTKMTIEGLFHKGRLLIAGTQNTLVFTNNYEAEASHATEGIVHMTNTHGSTTFVPSSTCRITNTGAGPAVKATNGARIDAENCRLIGSSLATSIESNGDILLNNVTCQGAVEYTGNTAFGVNIKGSATDITSSSSPIDLSGAGGSASALVVGAYLVHISNGKVLDGSGTNITYGGITIPAGFGTLDIGDGIQMAVDGSTIRTDKVNVWTKQQNIAQGTLVDVASILWDLADNQTAKVLLAGNRALANPTNMVAGATYILIVTQDPTGTRTLTYDTVYKFPGGAPPVLSVAPNAIDVLVFVSDGTNMLGNINKDFS